MQLVTFSHQGQIRLGARVTRDDRSYVLDLNRARPSLPAEMIAFLNEGDAALVLARQAIAAACGRDLVPETDIRQLAPVPCPGKIICLGHNYNDHMGQGNEVPPEHPTFFCKTANTIIGPGQPIVLPKISQQVDIFFEP